MTTTVISFPTATPDSRASAARPRTKPSRALTRPSASLALVLRGAGPSLQPERVALDLLATGSNAAASPVWQARKAAFRALIAPRRLPFADQHRLTAEFRAAVRAAGIAEKARRRQDEIDKFKIFEWIAAHPGGGLDRA